jgi:predicted RNase H-like HicB family nuclease
MYSVDIMVIDRELAVSPRLLTEVREALGLTFNEAIHSHRPIPIARGTKSREVALLIGLAEMAQLVRPYRFRPAVLRESAAINIWLPEFGIYGRGRTLEEAKRDLLEEVREYVADYFEDIERFRMAPNRRSQFGHVIKALVADLSGELERVIFPDPAEV